MTKLSEGRRCAYCRRPLTQRTGPGRPSKYCRRSHRQRAYEARQRAAEKQLTQGQVIVSQSDLDRLHDGLYALEAALDDVAGDMRDARTVADYISALDHLRMVAEELRGTVVHPVTA